MAKNKKKQDVVDAVLATKDEATVEVAAPETTEAVKTEALPIKTSPDGITERGYLSKKLKNL
jgi:hypothetical protein